MAKEGCDIPPPFFLSSREFTFENAARYLSRRLFRASSGGRSPRDVGRGGEKVASNGSDKKFSRSPEIKLSTLSLPSLRGVELDFPLSADRQLISTSTPTTSMLARLSFCVGSTRSLYATRS